MSASNQVYSASSFLSLILVLIPLSWHLEAWNTGTVLYMIWTAISLLIHFVNSVVWNGNVINHAPVWCDIATKLIIGSAIGIPCASLCITRRLYYISGLRTVTTSVKDKRKEMAVDLSIGVVIPMVVMALHYVVQGHRFDILEDVGCVPTTYNVTLTYVLMQIPALSIPLISAIYAVLSIRTFLQRQAEFKKFLSSGSSSLSSSRYLRLMALASMEIIFALPLSLMHCILNATVYGPVNPWVSWEVTHFEFESVWLVTAEEWKADSLHGGIVELSRWSAVLCGLVFFAFFGFAQEARSHYKKAIANVCALVGVKSPFKPAVSPLVIASSSKGATLQGSNFSKFKISTPGTGGNSSHSALPIYVQKEVINKRDSFDDSHSDFMSLKSATECATLSKIPYSLPAGLSGPPSSAGNTYSNTSTVVGPASAAPSRSGSPTAITAPSPIALRPRIEISSAIYPEDFPSLTVMRTPESAFPTSVTPDIPPSFLEMVTPGSESMLSRSQTFKSPDNRV